MKTNFKKLALALSLCTTITLGATAMAAEFTDMPEGEVGVAMQAAVDNGLLNGMGDNLIGPDFNITRSQMGAILVRAFGATKTADISAFSDMNPEAWYYGEMSKAVAMGAFQGDGSNLNPEKNITFQEAFVVLSRIFDLASKDKYGLAEAKADPFANISDADSVAPWAKPDVELILKYGYWTPENGLLRPTEYITRAEFAVVMNNLVKLYIDAEDITDTKDITIQTPGENNTLVEEVVTKSLFSDFPVEGNVIVRVSDVIISDFDQVNNDIYLSESVSGDVYFENCNLDRVVSRSTDCVVNFLGDKCACIKLFDREPDPDKATDCYITKGTVKTFYGTGSYLKFSAEQL